jgi:hypothetical protein
VALSPVLAPERVVMLGFIVASVSSPVLLFAKLVDRLLL